MLSQCSKKIAQEYGLKHHFRFEKVEGTPRAESTEKRGPALIYNTMVPFATYPVWSDIQITDA